MNFNEKRLVTQKEMMAFTSLSRGALYLLRKQGKIPAYKIGGSVRYDIDEVKEALRKG